MTPKISWNCSQNCPWNCPEIIPKFVPEWFQKLSQKLSWNYPQICPWIVPEIVSEIVPEIVHKTFMNCHRNCLKYTCIMGVTSNPGSHWQVKLPGTSMQVPFPQTSVKIEHSSILLQVIPCSSKAYPWFRLVKERVAKSQTSFFLSIHFSHYSSLLLSNQNSR